MPIRVDAYMAGGIASGTVDRAGQLRDLLETSTDMTLAQTSWQPIDGADPQAAGDMTVTIDDVLMVVSDDDPYISMHAAWHGISLHVGPYLVVGELPTLPGFDPGRALTRPSGEFVMLREVRLGLVGEGDETVAFPHALINRYGVDRVSADIMLGFFFPGAVMDEPEGTHAPLSAGVERLPTKAPDEPEAAAQPEAAMEPDAVTPPEPATPAGT
jgi:hypothetical protein